MPQPDLPPNNYQAQDLGQIVSVQPVDSNTELQVDQGQSQEAGANSQVSTQTNPVFNDFGTNNSHQINTGYGRNTEQCMNEVGCENTPFIDFTTYYGHTNNWQDNNNNSFRDLGSGANTWGGAVRFMFPLGDGFGGKLDELAAERVIREQNDNALKTQAYYAKALQMDAEALETCISLRNPTDGKVGYIDPNTQGKLARRVLDMCEGIGVALADTPDNRDLVAENELLREKLKQYSNHGNSIKVGN